VGRHRPNLRYPIFNQIGASPSYRGITLHGGYRNMQFSRYTLNNHTFLGGGIEMQLGKFRAAGMYGRLRQGAREISEDIDLFFDVPLYNRYAYAARVGWGSVESHFDIIYFRGEDRDPNVDLASAVDTSSTFPAQAENTIVGFKWRQKFGKNINFYAEGAVSGFSRNKESDEFLPSNERLANLIEPFFTPRFSTQAGLAFRSGVAYRKAGFSIGLDYERIDPGFESMGTYFLNGDWENYRFNTGFGLFKNRLRLRGSFGLQQNNLLDQRAETSRRIIGSGLAVLQGGANWTLNLNYSNFSQDHRPTALVVLNDTLRIASTTQNIGGTWQLSSRKGQRNGIWMVTSNYQRTDNDNPLSDGFDAVNVLFNSINYTHQFPNQLTELRFSANYNSVDVGPTQTRGFGGTIGWRQQLRNQKVQFSLDNTFNRNAVNGTADGYSLVSRASVQWNVSALHAISANLFWLERVSDLGFGFSEQRGQLNYTLRLPEIGRKKETPSSL
ncbi:MAG: hypothetical protein AAGA62_10155, partial [Bacteroidota bacterium]